MPLTDKETLSMSNGPITSVDVVRKKDMKPIKGGIFDWEMTGGPNENGKYWTHINLPEPVVNKTWRKAASAILGMSEIDIDRVSRGEKKIDGETGGKALKKKLDEIDVKRDLAQAMIDAKSVTRSQRDKINRKIHILKALDRFKMTPSEAYITRKVPVIPPVMRLIRELPDGTKTVPDINYLYQDLTTLSLKSYPDAKEFGTEET